MEVGELVTKWGFKVDSSGLDKVGNQLEGLKRGLEFLAAAEVVKGVFELTERFAHFAEEIHLAAQSAGITAESFQKLAFAARQSGVQQEEMTGAMARLGRHLYEARTGSAQAQMIFQRVGFSPEQIRGFRSSSDVMLALSDRMKGMTDPMAKQAIAMQLLGRSSFNMVGFLSKGSGAIRGMGDEAERLGAVITDKQIEALVSLEHSLQRVWAVIKALGAAFASILAPSLEFITNQFLEFFAANRQLIQVNIEAWAHKFAYVLGFIYGMIEDGIKLFLKFAKAMHFEGHIGTIVFGIMAIIGSMFALKGALTGASLAWTALKWAMSPIGSLIGIVQKAATLGMTALRALAGSETLAAAGAAILEAPLWLIVAAIGAAIVVIHDLWKLFTGKSLKDTWIGQFVEWVKSFGVIKSALEWITNLFSKGGIGGMLSGPLGLAGKMLGGLTEGAKGLIGGPEAGNLTSAMSMMTAPAPGAAPVAGPNQYSVNAPINITVPPGSDHQMVGQKVREGVRDHLDRVHRETQRQLVPQQAY